MKSLFFTLVCLVGITAQAQQQSSEARALAQQVNALVQANLQALPPQSRQYVTDSLRGVVQTFAMNGIDVRPGGGHRPPPPPPPPPPYQPARNLFCDSSDNTLRDLNANGALVYDFTDAANCAEAKSYVVYNQPFCDYNDNTVHRADGGLIYDFTNKQDCQVGRQAIAYGRNFCDSNDNTLRDSYGTLIYDFSNPADCQAALNQTN